MKTKFDLVRIGKARKDYSIEKSLKDNKDLLISRIRLFIENTVVNKKNDEIHMIIVIPAKGHNPKILLESVRDEDIRKGLKQNFPNFIYKGKPSIVEDNYDNKVFR
ncbi:hypothetical protein [Psychroserpens luteus]|uniref:Uncharacterized protein n=1 Tax=Psychroserpens luteus TaxID=1434066 RepID=A0ABW5ZXR0_9FLAO|nr:hypothetical protein [Psychroserpens luteus]